MFVFSRKLGWRKGNRDVDHPEITSEMEVQELTRSLDLGAHATALHR